MTNVAAIIPAAGLGLRLKSRIPKPLVTMGTKPIVIHTLEAFHRNRYIKRIILAVGEKNIDRFRIILDKYRIKKNIDLVCGGSSRGDSVRNCLEKIPNDADFILVHDAVRPFVSFKLISRLINEVKISEAVICGVPAKSTLKSIGKDYKVCATLDRKDIWEIQTPQVFRKELLIKAYHKYRNLAVTDDASLVERLGVKVKVIYGSYFNIKVTTPEDLVFANAILKSGYV